MQARIKPEVARRLAWSRPDSAIAPFCSVCQAHIAEDDVPLMMWDGAGACVQFCDECAQEGITWR